MTDDYNGLLFRHVTKYFLPQLDINDLVYHYTSPIGLKNILETKELWASDFAFLNDKSETLYLYEILQFVIKDEKLKKKLDDNFIQELEKIKTSYIEKLINNYCRYICSFSLNPDSLSLWNYYTKTASRTGYNICFSWASLKEKIGELSRFEIECGKVVYDQDEQISILERTIVGYNSSYTSAKSDTERAEILSELEQVFNILSVYFKHPAFENEEEVRICLTQKINTTTSRQAKYRESNGIFIPYINIEFTANAIKQIGISPLSQRELSINGISSMLLDLEYTDVPIKVSKIPLRN